MGPGPSDIFDPSPDSSNIIKNLNTQNRAASALTGLDFLRKNGTEPVTTQETVSDEFMVPVWTLYVYMDGFTVCMYIYLYYIIYTYI